MSGKCGGNGVDKSLDEGAVSKKDLIDLNYFGTTPCAGMEYTLRSLNVNKYFPQPEVICSMNIKFLFVNSLLICL